MLMLKSFIKIYQHKMEVIDHQLIVYLIGPTVKKLIFKNFK